MSVVSQNIYFNYSKYSKPVLNDVNLIVKKGEIFGLIGPSGCGKTTFLKIITGLCKPDFGTILVFGYPPGSKQSGVPGVGVGYIPQELALQSDLTIDEIIWYFGRVYYLSNDQIKNEVKYWVSILSLPEETRLIANMSEGQKRRLSFAISMMHRPRLLVVDEPTAGVDPILCKTMWDLMITFAKNNESSVIITTHYFSEAKRADFIAFMRKGQILEKGPPKMLCDRYNLKSIDELFVVLSTRQHQKNSYRRRNTELINQPEKIKELRRESCLEEFERSFSLTAKYEKIMAVVVKYLNQTKRSPLAMLLFFVASILASTLAVCTIGHPPDHIPVGWVVNESLPGSLNVSSLEEDLNSLYLPEVFKNSLNTKTIELKNFLSLTEANEQMRKGLLKGVFYFGPNFTDYYLDLTFGFNDDFINNSMISKGSIHLRLVEEGSIISDAVLFTTYKAILKFQKKVASILGTGVLNEPIIKSEQSEEEQADLFGIRNFIAPGYLLGSLFCFPFLISSLTFSIELTENTFTRSIVAGVSLFQTLLARIFSIFIFCFAASLSNFFLTVRLAQISYATESLALIFPLMWLQSLSGITVGILLAVLVNNTLFCFFLATVSFLNLFFTNGIFKTMLSQPYYIRYLNYCFPLTLPLKTMRSLVAGENSLSNHLIWPGFAVSFAWIGFAFFLCIFILKIRN